MGLTLNVPLDASFSPFSHLPACACTKSDLMSACEQHWECASWERAYWECMLEMPVTGQWKPEECCPPECPPAPGTSALQGCMLPSAACRQAWESFQGRRWWASEWAVFPWLCSTTGFFGLWAAPQHLGQCTWAALTPGQPCARVEGTFVMCSPTMKSMVWGFMCAASQRSRASPSEKISWVWNLGALKP